MAKKLLFFGIFTLVSWFQVQGQGCSCTGTVYYYDGDGYTADWDPADRGIAMLYQVDSGCGEGVSGNIIFS